MGLSYTSFGYSDLAVTSGDAGLAVSLTVTNTGERAGREVVQAYVSVPDSLVVRVPRELKGFVSVTLEPGESRRVEIAVERDELAYWSVVDHAWVVEGGSYTVEVGSSSRDLRTLASVEVAGNEPARPLTLQSTVAEAMTVPGFDAVLAPMITVFGADPDLIRMMESMPLAALLGFSGQSEDTFQSVLDGLNAAQH